MMEAVQKYPYSRLAACSPGKLLPSPELHPCIFVTIALAPKAKTAE